MPRSGRVPQVPPGGWKARNVPGEWGLGCAEDHAALSLGRSAAGRKAMIPVVRVLAALAAASGLTPDGAAQSPASPGFDASADAAVRRAADSLELSPSQRT